MTAEFDKRNEWLTGSWDGIFQQAVDVFDCRMYAANSTSRGKEGKRRQKKQSQIHTTIEKFRRIMSGPNPPQTKQQAVEAIAPLVTLILSIFFRRFAIQVIEWLWDQLEQQDAAT